MIKKYKTSEEVKAARKKNAKNYYLKNKEKIKVAALKWYYEHSTCERRRKGPAIKVKKSQKKKDIRNKTSSSKLEAQAERSSKAAAPLFRDYIRKLLKDYEEENR
jgi:hypothetical protein